MTDNHDIPPQETADDTAADIQLVAAIDVIHKAASDLDDFAHVAKLAVLGNIGQEPEPRRFVIPGNDDEIMPAPFHQLSWKAREVNADNIAQLIVRIPVLPAREGPYPEKPHGVQEWSDLLLEVFRTDGSKARYLFNSRGIKAYTDASGLTFNFIKNDDGELVAMSSDIFSVVNEDVSAPPISVNGLLDFIKTRRLSNLEQQAVKPEEQQFRRRAEDRKFWKRKRK